MDKSPKQEYDPPDYRELENFEVALFLGTELFWNLREGEEQAII